MNLCGDNSCLFGRPHGLGTNGGCRCMEHVGNEGGHGEKTRKVVLEINKLHYCLDESRKKIRNLRAAIKGQQRCINKLKVEHNWQTLAAKLHEARRQLRDLAKEKIDSNEWEVVEMPDGHLSIVARRQ